MYVPITCSPLSPSSWSPRLTGPPASRTVFALIIINKAGGLIYNKTFHDAGLQKISTNDYLVLAGTFHGYVSSAKHHRPTAY